MLAWVKKLTEKFSRLFAIGDVCFFGSGKRTNIEHFPVMLDAGVESLSALSDTLVAGSILGRSSHIPVILTCGRFTKISDPVVQSIAVNMVDLFWKIAVHPQPNKSVSQLALSIDADLIIPVTTDTPLHNTSRRTGDSNKSNELSGFRVIVEQLSDFCESNFVAFKFSHGSSFQS